MDDQLTPRWLAWARQIQALSQSGLAYTQNPYDVQRYHRLMEIAAEMVQDHTAQATAELLASFVSQVGYATPKVDVRGAVVQEGKILLVQESRDQRWCMPGGWADVGELPSTSVEREVSEESGFQVRAHKVIGVFDANRSAGTLSFFHAYKIVFMCELLGGAARPSDETTAVDFFSFDNLPPLSALRTNERHLAEVLAHLNDPERSAAFD
jgi:ADP-ribose pyrophosphatase YjhB (NUDIX family)